MPMTTIRHNTVIWDWNGTLLDDVDISIAATQALLAERGLPLLTKERYKEVFGFPVRNYYATIGFDFDKEPFEIPANQYMDNYRAMSPDAKLNSEAISTMLKLKELGCRQYILSAMENSLLGKMTKDTGILPYLDGTFGIENDYADSKSHIGKRMVMHLNLDPRYCLMVGDTLHDAEVAKECGFDCVLFAGGHFSKSRLVTLQVPVIDRLSEIFEFV